MMTISSPYVIQSGFEYMNDSSGPTMDCPCKWKMMPEIPMIIPIIRSAIPPFMSFFLVSTKKG